MPTYMIIPNPRLPTHDGPRGWRRWLPSFLRPRSGRVVVNKAPLVLECHPDTVSVLATWLRAQGYDYRVQLRDVGGAQ